jgi:hypothetical protein
LNDFVAMLNVIRDTGSILQQTGEELVTLIDHALEELDEVRPFRLLVDLTDCWMRAERAMETLKQEAATLRPPT